MPIRRKGADPAPEESVLPPGQRDSTGFWYPAGYAEPRTLVRRRPRRRREEAGGPADTDPDTEEKSPS